MHKERFGPNNSKLIDVIDLFYKENTYWLHVVYDLIHSNMDTVM